MIGKLLEVWKAHSVLARVVSVLVLVVAVLLIAGAGAGAVEHFRGRAFDRKEALREAEVTKKDAEIEALKERATRAEAKGELAEQRAEALDAVAKQQGVKVQVAAKKVEEAFADYEKDSAITGSDVADDVRRQRICAKRKELGYPCK